MAYSLRIGNSTVTQTRIKSVQIRKEFDPIGAELRIGTLEAVINWAGSTGNFLPADYPDGMGSSDGITVECLERGVIPFIGMPFGTSVICYQDDHSLGQFYLKSVKQTGPEEITVSAVDWVGLLDGYDYPGYVFRTESNDITLGNVIYDIFLDSWLGASVPPMIEMLYDQMDATFDDLWDIPIHDGYIPHGTRRDALRMALFATNTCMREQTDGVLLLSKVTDAISGEINIENTYLEGKVNYPDPVSRISVTEYALDIQDNAAEEVIYDNTFGSVNDDIWFVCDDGKIYGDWRYEGFRSVASFRNYFHFVGRGKAYGKPYLIRRREVTVENPGVRAGSEIRIDCTAITAQNSAVVLDKLRAYYFENRTESDVDIVNTQESTGYIYSFRDPFGKDRDGFMSEAVTNVSAQLKTSCHMEADWHPHADNVFTHSEVLTGSGTWIVPDGVTRFFAVLVGGGAGGSSGLAGPDGTFVRKHSDTGASKSNYNGAMGTPGAGGRILQISVENPVASYAFSCGAGGAGGAVCSSTSEKNEGAAGGHTTFGSFTSAAGAESQNGIVDIFTNNRYGGTMPESVYKVAQKVGSLDYEPCAGFNSAAQREDTGAWVIVNAAATPVQYASYSKGVKTLKQTAAASTPAYSTTTKFGQGVTVYLCHGEAGGSAVNAKGGAGSRGYWVEEGSLYHLGNGGDGATPTVAGINPRSVNPQYYGWGGGPGYGGGAGGNPGWRIQSSSSLDSKLELGTAGKGGNGGAGGAGAPGCIIIYY